jgi:hypothetical protein
LIRDFLEANSTRGAEGSVVAKVAATFGHGSVHIWASEARVNANALDSASMLSLQESTK